MDHSSPAVLLPHPTPQPHTPPAAAASQCSADPAADQNFKFQPHPQGSLYWTQYEGWMSVVKTHPPGWPDLPHVCLLFRIPVPFHGITPLPPHLYPTFPLSLSPSNTWLLRKGWEIDAISDWGWGMGWGRGEGGFWGVACDTLAEGTGHALGRHLAARHILR